VILRSIKSQHISTQSFQVHRRSFDFSHRALPAGRRIATDFEKGLKFDLQTSK
jgi:hypothetical protein